MSATPSQADSRSADVIVVGAGLAGLVATAELADAGRRVLLLDQEPEASLGGQAFWSFGGLFLVNSPEECAARSLEMAHVAQMQKVEYTMGVDDPLTGSLRGAHDLGHLVFAPAVDARDSDRVVFRRGRMVDLHPPFTRPQLATGSRRDAASRRRRRPRAPDRCA